MDKFNKKEYNKQYNKSNIKTMGITFNKNNSEYETYKRLEFYAYCTNKSINAIVKQAIAEFLDRNDA